jgi:predicted glycosyltransferase
MISGEFPKAGIYFSHYECFGHTAHVMAVAEVFKKRFPQGNFFFIQAGVHQPKAKLDQLGRVYSLPGAFTDRRHFRELIQGAGADVDERSQACTDIVIRQRPDLFITEFFPLGREECRHELIPPLIKASAQGAVLWAVAGYPLLTGKNNGWREKIFKLYQQIIILSPSSEKDFIADVLTCEKDRQEYLDFLKRHEQKIIYAGYLSPRQEVVFDDEFVKLSKPPIPLGVCRVAVLRGGGAYFPKLIAEAIRASDLLGKDYYFTVVAGPSTTEQEWYFFNMLVAKKKVNNLVLHRAVGDYKGLIQKSDVCVSVASYHTSVMLLKHRKKAVLIPFEGHGPLTMHEQPARAAMLKEMIGAKVLPIQDLTAVLLASAVKDTASRKEISTHVPKEWFMGANVLDKALIGLFGR